MTAPLVASGARQRTVTRAIVAVFAAVSLVHLGAQLADLERLAQVSQWLLMPLLALALAAATAGAPRGRLIRLTLVSLAFSWLGDTAPDLAPEGASFIVMIAFFLVAQVVFVAAFWPFRRASVLSPAYPARRRWLAVPYLLALVALVVTCAPGAGSLLVPVIVYGTTLALMAALATGVGRLVAIGGAIFVVSDSLIALNAFVDGWSLPGQGFWVMVTYIAAQTLIVVGVVGEGRREGPVRAGVAAAG
ncbi:Uncharacterized membrane protein YhhN [Sanguibacter gelidistatuariae]|uniref:Uncharacterized membrane protein YhhN n=1 Tax=Sanguibacter gelidistatuariae TaxID=1814289 RepID=A0A1G6TIV3_9MICO|nr:lysoplasmalogenase [Sanguibacter gelidistatuariae]SDD28357.1 Uncharacterized membrane protein YhhN [Sanguibacter gelidistatuariae]